MVPPSNRLLHLDALHPRRLDVEVVDEERHVLSLLHRAEHLLEIALRGHRATRLRVDDLDDDVALLGQLVIRRPADVDVGDEEAALELLPELRLLRELRGDGAPRMRSPALAT